MGIIDIPIPEFGILPQVYWIFFDNRLVNISFLGISINNFVSSINEIRRQEERKMQIMMSLGINLHKPCLIIKKCKIVTNRYRGRLFGSLLSLEKQRIHQERMKRRSLLQKQCHCRFLCKGKNLTLFASQIQKYFRASQCMWRIDDSRYNNVQFLKFLRVKLLSTVLHHKIYLLPIFYCLSSNTCR